MESVVLGTNGVETVGISPIFGLYALMITRVEENGWIELLSAPFDFDELKELNKNLGQYIKNIEEKHDCDACHGAGRYWHNKETCITCGGSGKRS